MCESSGAWSAASSFRSIAGIPSGPVALWGLMASSNVLTPATDTVICGNSLYGLTPRLGALLAFPMVKTDENCILRMSALAWLSL